MSSVDYPKLAAEQIRKEVPPGYSEAWYALVAERATTLEQAARIETLEKAKAITLSEIVDALDYASEGRTWSGPKPDLLANYLNRRLNRSSVSTKVNL